MARTSLTGRRVYACSVVEESIVPCGSYVQFMSDDVGVMIFSPEDLSIPVLNPRVVKMHLGDKVEDTPSRNLGLKVSTGDCIEMFSLQTGADKLVMP